MSPNIAGALLMTASMVSFTINDTFLKLTSGALPLGQLLAVRGAMASVCIILLAWALGGLSLRASREAWRLILWRSFSEIAAAYCFVSALLNMPLANVSAILQVLPLTVTLGAFVLFKDPVGWRRMAAIGVGFVGMLIMVRPGAEGFSIWSLYAFGAVLSVTVRDLITRAMPGTVSSLMVATTNTVTVGLFFAVLSIGDDWQPITADIWQLLIGSTVFIIGGYYFSVQVMRVGEISFIAPFRYTSLLAALILGWLAFDDWPDNLTLLGAVIVVGAGLFTLWRERVTQRA